MLYSQNTLLHTFCLLILFRTGSLTPQTVIQSDSLEMGQELGLGEFGSVLKGVWTSPQGEKVSRHNKF